jgi:broad specificity phosphatase PhoE
VSTNGVIASLLVVRHGQSLWNIEERWQGRADIELSDLGIAQARQAAQRLGTFDYIASSTLLRALRTAHIISEAQGVGPVETDERLQETHVGPWEGLTRTQIEAQWPGFLASRTKPEGFESDEAIVERLTAAFIDIGQRCEGGTALIISHSGVIRTLRHVLGASNPRLPNLGGSWFHVHRDNRISVGDLVTLVDDDLTTESL